MAEQDPQPGAARPIAILLHSLAPGGAQFQVIALANRFVDLGHKVELLLLNDCATIGREPDPQIRVRMIAGGTGKPMGPRSWIAVWGLSRYLRSERPYIFMSGVNLTHALSIRAWRASDRSAPVVLRLCSKAKLWPDGLSLAAVARRLWGRNEELYGEADGLIAVSQDTAEGFRHVKSIRDREIEVIYNPAATASLLDRAVARMSAGCSGTATILAAGTFYRTKDFPTLIRAFALIRGKVRSRLVLLGDGEDRNHLQTLAKDLGVAADVEFPGWTNDMPGWIDRASVLVSCSLFEGLQATLIEAIALGCPVVATDCPGGNREILEHGALGPLVPVGDHNALAAAILNVLEAPPDSKRLRDSARRFGEDGKAEAYLRVFRKLVEDRRA